MNIGKDFYNILVSEVFTDISRASNELQTDLINIPTDEAKDIYDSKINEMENMVLAYIRAQKTIFLEVRTVV